MRDSDEDEGIYCGIYGRFGCGAKLEIDAEKKDWKKLAKDSWNDCGVCKERHQDGSYSDDIFFCCVCIQEIDSDGCYDPFSKLDPSSWCEACQDRMKRQKAAEAEERKAKTGAEGQKAAEEGQQEMVQRKANKQAKRKKAAEELEQPPPVPIDPTKVCEMKCVCQDIWDRDVTVRAGYTLREEKYALEYEGKTFHKEFFDKNTRKSLGWFQGQVEKVIPRSKHLCTGPEKLLVRYSDNSIERLTVQELKEWLIKHKINEDAQGPDKGGGKKRRHSKERVTTSKKKSLLQVPTGPCLPPSGFEVAKKPHARKATIDELRWQHISHVFDDHGWCIGQVRGLDKDEGPCQGWFLVKYRGESFMRQQTLNLRDYGKVWVLLKAVKTEGSS